MRSVVKRKRTTDSIIVASSFSLNKIKRNKKVVPAKKSDSHVDVASPLLVRADVVIVVFVG